MTLGTTIHGILQLGVIPLIMVVHGITTAGIRHIITAITDHIVTMAAITGATMAIITPITMLTIKIT
jgi:hypothetical protein